MSWVKVDDRVWCHPKFLGLSASAVRLWLWALCWCSQHETDGTFPTSMLAAIGGTKKTAAELVSRGLWEPAADGGWTVHDYLSYQPSREQRRAQRENGLARVKRYRGSGNGDCNAASNGACNGVTPAAVTGDETASARRRAHAGANGPGSGSGSPEGEAGEDRETTCPPDLAARLEALGVVAELAAGYRVSEPDVRHVLGEFVGYWTLGAGTGKRRRNWPAKARERVREAATQGKLSGAAGPAPDAAGAALRAAQADRIAAAETERRRRELAERYPDVTEADKAAAKRAMGLS